MTAEGDTIPVTVEFKRVEHSIGAGLRQEWIAGDNGRGVTFDLTAGAGLGNPYMTLTVKLPDGTTVSEVASVAPMVTDMVTRILTEHGLAARP